HVARYVAEVVDREGLEVPASGFRLPHRNAVPGHGSAPERYLGEGGGKAAGDGEELMRSPLLLQDEIAEPSHAQQQCLGERDRALGLGLLQQRVTFVETPLEVRAVPSA